MRPLVGWGLSGHSHSVRDLASASLLGRPTWGPGGLLRDLELRLGLPAVEAPSSTRIPTWAVRMDRLLSIDPFYARSFVVDRLGTAATLLSWRDDLLDAGWNGKQIPGGGDRLDALSALESLGEVDASTIATADRLVRVERELQRHSHRIYDGLSLVERRTSWPTRWKSIFDLLEKRGTMFLPLDLRVPAAAGDSDLGVLQRLLRGDESCAPVVRGDRSLLILRGDTSTELAELTAGFLATGPNESVVVRCRDIAPLEAALSRHGLARQGHTRPSQWRPAMQVLPLAIELAFEPRDPYRVLELLTLTVGPFRGLLGRALARAVSRQPGIGGQEWNRQKEFAFARMRLSQVRFQRTELGRDEVDAEQAADAYVATRVRRLSEWLERPGIPSKLATREALLEVAERVREWQASARIEAPAVHAVAYAQTCAFYDALRRDPRKELTQEQIRQLLDRMARGMEGHALSLEQADRIPHVAHPSALLASSDTVVVWGCVAGAERRPKRMPWNAEERDALAFEGVHFQDPSELLRIEGDAWRRVVLAAKKRLVFVVPNAIDGEPTAIHPLLDEVIARLGLSEDGADIISIHSRTLLAKGGEGLIAAESLPPLPLPEARPMWSVSSEVLVDPTRDRGFAVTSLEKLASCPLSWVLEQRARLRPGAISRVATGPLLNGNLSHRLVEELHRQGAFDRDLTAFLSAVEEQLDLLLHHEGATLLLEGAANERTQLRRQITSGMRALHRYLRDAGFLIVAVEEQVQVTSTSGNLEGRLDIRLEDRRTGAPAVLDLKWGASTYRRLLEGGRAVQLAVYARGVGFEHKTTTMPPAGYFAVSSAKPLSSDERMVTPGAYRINGPSLEETWNHVEATTKAVLEQHSHGHVHVLATKKSLPLLEALGIPAASHSNHYAPDPEHACKYCVYDGLCGRAWEAIG